MQKLCYFFDVKRCLLLYSASKFAKISYLYLLILKQFRSLNIYNTKSDNILNTRNVKSVINGNEIVSYMAQ